MDKNTLVAMKVVMESAQRHLADAGEPMKQYGQKAYEIVEKWLKENDK